MIMNHRDVENLSPSLPPSIHRLHWDFPTSEPSLSEELSPKARGLLKMQPENGGSSGIFKRGGVNMLHDVFW